uniref:Uncharacterized protein n=1 Tax=Timema shepardi TaxID=629360 RepID=A0A7R9ASC9_TIMSH|nr:unnamed protein product [Timema shepardi]
MSDARGPTTASQIQPSGRRPQALNLGQGLLGSFTAPFYLVSTSALVPIPASTRDMHQHSTHENKYDLVVYQTLSPMAPRKHPYLASSDESPVAMKLKKMWLKAPISEDCDTNLVRGIHNLTPCQEPGANDLSSSTVEAIYSRLWSGGDAVGMRFLCLFLVILGDWCNRHS